MNERAWVETVREELAQAFSHEAGIAITTALRLPYALHVERHRSRDGKLLLDDPVTLNHGYQTDLLIAEQSAGGEHWTPRVVVEFKKRKVSTHDALTYSTKAGTHKSVYPYLRYGIVIGEFDGPVPKRLIRHGQHFDFMMTLPSTQRAEPGRNALGQLLSEELEASRILSSLMASRSDISLLHRKLWVTRQ